MHWALNCLQSGTEESASILTKVQGDPNILPDSKVKNIFWTAYMINEPQLGYFVRIELYTRTVSSE